MSPWYAHLDNRFMNLSTGQPFEAFIPGVTQPYYVETADLDGPKNVGAFGQLTPYPGTPGANGILQITTAGLYENYLFSHPTEVRAAAGFKNCMWLIPPSWTFAKPFAVITILNGTNSNNIEFDNVEIHNRAQRPMNGIQGRNFVFRQGVVTGSIDPWSESAGGTAPLVNNRGFEVYDSVAPTIAFWYSNPANTEIHSDEGSHSDVYQSNTTLDVLLDNVTMGAYVSEFIGTGTPGSGSEMNPYNPPSGNDYIQSQAQMEAWRDQFTTMTNAAQSMGGISRRLQLVGSQAGIMLNRGAVTARHCWFGGGTVGINAVDGNVIASTVHLIDNTWWNDMLNGHKISGVETPTKKGHAILASLNRTFGTFTGNRWAPELGGALLAPSSEGGYWIYR